MKMDHSNWTLRFPRTTRCDGYAIHVYKRPWYEKLAMLLFRWGWVLLLVLVFALTGCGPNDHETAVLVAQDLQDAVQQARGER